MSHGMKDFGDLKTRVLRQLELEEDLDSQQMVKQWIEEGLTDVWDRLRAWWMLRAAKVTVLDGKFKLPPSYISMQAVVPLAGGTPLRPLTSEQASDYWAMTGTPQYYLVEGEWCWLLPPQTSSVTLRVSYYSMLQPLVNDDDTNDLLRRAPTVAVYAGAYHGALYRGDDAAAARYGQYLVDKIERINDERFGDADGSGYVMTRG